MYNVDTIYKTTTLISTFDESMHEDISFMPFRTYIDIQSYHR